MAPTIVTDGSAEADRPTQIRIDLDDAADRWRYTCLHGHRNWERNNHSAWCRSCARDHDIADPHHDALLDLSTGETVPWSAIEFVDE